MANITAGGIRKLDTFGADVVIDAGVYTLNAMYITAYTSAKTSTFLDNDAVVILVLEVAAGATGQITPSKPIRFPNGLTFDDSASDLAAGDFVFLYGQD